MSGLSTFEEAARQRLEAYYNGQAYSAATNRGGLAAGGHQINFEPSLEDVATVSKALARIALEVAAQAEETGADLTSVLAAAGQLSGINLGATGVARNILLGGLAWADRAPPFAVPIESGASPVTLAAHQVGAAVFTDGQAVTLPVWAVTPAGWWCSVKNISASVNASIAPPAGSTIEGSAAAVSIIPGDAVAVIRTQTDYRLM